MNGDKHLISLTQEQIKIAVAQYVELMFQGRKVELGDVTMGVLTSQAAAVHGAFFYAEVAIKKEGPANVQIEHSDDGDLSIRVVDK